MLVIDWISAIVSPLLSQIAPEDKLPWPALPIGPERGTAADHTELSAPTNRPGRIRPMVRQTAYQGATSAEVGVPAQERPRRDEQVVPTASGKEPRERGSPGPPTMPGEPSRFVDGAKLGESESARS
jgi:hypothetical protein